MNQKLTITILGASGDLAKKKTYPSLFDLFCHDLLPSHVTIVGFARSKMTDEAFREHIAKLLPVRQPEDEAKRAVFLQRCHYRAGQYGSHESFTSLASELSEWEDSQETGEAAANRLYYFAIPPNVFLENAAAIKACGMSGRGWTRVIIEKPFGNDLESANKLVKEMNSVLTEEQIYRIDHYLGKEVVQSLLMLRFGNSFLEPLMNRHYVDSVTITFKEDFGTQGRGGYFDHYGIVRDIMQNHLMQVLSLVAMEAPITVSGGQNSGNDIRDSKVALLKSMEQVSLDDVVLGQYVGDGNGNEGYLEDPTVPDDSKTATYAVAVLKIRNQRWDGVPFIMKAGKALDSRKAEIRIQFKPAPALGMLFSGQNFSRNELVLRIQPDEAVYLKCSTKAPGLRTEPITSELDLSYKTRYSDTYSPDAYTRLILESLRGKQATFVRSDELIESWRIWTPVLEQIEQQQVQPLPYTYGSRGPAAGDELCAANGYVRDDEYKWPK